MSLDNFLSWEATTRDTIDFKKIYVDMADDLVAGLMLSQIVFWHIPNKDGANKLRVSKDGHMWIAKGHSEWYQECRITEWQSPRALKILKEKGIIDTGLYKFNGVPTVHIRIVEDVFVALWAEKMGVSPKSILVNRQNGNEGITRMETRESLESLTETTTETTTDVYLSGEQKSFLKKYLDVMGYDAFSKKDRLIPLGDSLVPIGIKDALELLEQYGEPLVLEGAAWAAEKGMNPNRAARALKTALPNWKDNEIKERRSAGKDTKPDEIDTDELAAWLEGVKQNAAVS